ncbi:hypothetical protein FRC20_000681 [Serendipita sp. 405]|nr:hypothetical protein FRC20_000681 [Serendipita sp. 405]
MRCRISRVENLTLVPYQSQRSKIGNPDGLSRLFSRFSTRVSSLSDTVRSATTKHFGRCKEQEPRQTQELNDSQDATNDVSSPHDLIPWIDLLPPELLAAIFQEYVELGRSPWNLACVCVKWREVALRIAVLWKHLLVIDNRRMVRRFASQQVPGYRNRLIFGRFQICMTAEQVDDAVSRTGSVLLDVKIALSQQKDPDVLPANNSLDLLLKVFGTNGIHRRIGSISIYGLPSTVPSFPQPLIASFPYLNSFTCTTGSTEWFPLIGQMLSPSRGLTYLRLNARFLDVVKHSEFWGTLQDLHVGESALADPHVCEIAANTALSRCQRLESLHIGTATRWPNANSPTVSHNKLLNAQLHCHPRYLGQLRAPLLKILDITEFQQSTECTSVDTSGFPAVEKLTAWTSDPRWIYGSKFSNLISLSITSPYHRIVADTHWGGVPPNEVFVPNAFPLVEEVKFHVASTDITFIAALESVPNAQKITIVPGVLPNPTFGQDLLPRLSGPEPFVLCPKAQRIQIGIRLECLDASKDILEPLVQTVVDDRQRGGSPLESFIIYWPRPILMKEYVKHEGDVVG